MTVLFANRFELRWEPLEAPPAYRTREILPAFRDVARKLGFNLCELAPGVALCPYHAHLVNEELFVVLEGAPCVRLSSGEHPLRAGDVVALPAGPESAHQLLNRSPEPAVLLAVSTRVPREVVEYPDSGKRLVTVAELQGDADRAPYPSLLREGPTARLLLRDGLPAAYFDGEPLDALASPGEPPAGRDPRIVGLEGPEWETPAAGPFAGRRRRVGRLAGARRLGASVYRLEAGERPWPYHFHHVNEELALVLAGEGRLRGPGGEARLRAGDLALFPSGPEGAHALRGEGPRPLEVLVVSTMEQPEVVEVPDTQALYVRVGSAPGEAGETAPHLAFRRGDARSWGEDER